MTSGARVTVLLPVFDGGLYLGQAIESVLAQTLSDFELLVIDDGSQDESLAVARSYRDPRLRVLENGRNRGLTATLNRGLREAKAPLVARLDADDVCVPERLERQVDAMARRPELALLGSQAAVIDAAGRRVALLARGCEPETIRWELLFNNAFVHSSVVFRRDLVLGAFGGYDERIRYCQDFDLWSRLARAHPVANLDRELVRCRAHASSMTATGGAGNVRETDAVIATNLGATLGDEVTADDLARIPELRLGLPRGQPRAFLEAYERLLGAYRRRYLGTAPTADFRRAVARHLSTLLRVSRLRHAGVDARVLRLQTQGYPVAQESLRYLAEWARGRSRSTGPASAGGPVTASGATRRPPP
jgi:Glycosyl transferase family 2